MRKKGRAMAQFKASQEEETPRTIMANFMEAHKVSSSNASDLINCILLHPTPYDSFMEAQRVPTGTPHFFLMQIALQEDAVNASEIFTRGKSDRDISLGASYSTRYYLFSCCFCLLC